MEDKQHTVLCIDDEKNILNALKRLLRKEDYRLLTAAGGQQGLDILAQNEVHVVISDQRMPEMSGTEFLKQVKKLYPQVIRIILTAYTDLGTITESINEGSIYKFFLKPWNDQNLKLEIRQALDQYDLMEANKRLHQMIVQQNEELKAINDDLEAIVNERTQSLKVQNQALQLSRAILDDVPLPIIGISSEMMIVMINKAANAFLQEDFPMGLGDNIIDFFDNSIKDRLQCFLKSREPCWITSRGLNKEKPYRMQLLPLTGHFNGKGIIMILQPEG